MQRPSCIPFLASPTNPVWTSCALDDQTLPLEVRKLVETGNVLRIMKITEHGSDKIQYNVKLVSQMHEIDEYLFVTCTKTHLN